jgi:putative transcriptional regulator
MISHHPSFELIQAFVNGELPASLAAGVAIHADMCPKCQHTIAQCTEQLAEASFEEEYLDRFIVDDVNALDTLESLNFDHMIDDIVSSTDIDIIPTKTDKVIEFKGTNYTLPKTLNRMELGSNTHIGKLSRSRIHLNEGDIHTNLLHIEPGGGVPKHTHKGFELTVLLEGSFHDESGEYVKGDFIMLDGSNQHQPVSTNGCLCYTVANDALHFTQGINKLLNPIGSFIY